MINIAIIGLKKHIESDLIIDKSDYVNFKIVESIEHARGTIFDSVIKHWSFDKLKNVEEIIKVCNR